MTGGEKVWLCVHDLTEDIKALHKASKEDDQRDDDNDGIPDVKQVLYIKTAHRVVLLRVGGLGEGGVLMVSHAMAVDHWLVGVSIAFLQYAGTERYG